MLHLITPDGDAGYNKAHVKLSEKKKGEGLPCVRNIFFRGLEIDIQLDRGMEASGKDPDGKPWSVKYEVPYGEVPRTISAHDHDPIDVYVLEGGEDKPFVYCVNQQKKSGKFDEQKFFLGFDSPIDATSCYYKHGPPWGFMSLVTLTWNEFVNGVVLGAYDFSQGPRLIVYPKDDF